jgi:hypothetical protein
MKVKACLRSGFCCSKAPCGFGEPVSNKNSQCKFLIMQEDGRSSCGKYDEIIKHPSSKFSPAFGAGCCMSMFNEKRDSIRKKFHNNEEIYVNVDY